MKFGLLFSTILQLNFLQNTTSFSGPNQPLIFPNSFSPIAKFNFIQSPLKDTLYDSEITRAKMVESIEENTHKIGDTILHGSYDLFLTGEKIHEFGDKLAFIHEDIEKYIVNKEKYIDSVNHQIGYTMVKAISAILPHVDTIGHKVLHMDDEIINFFINMENISPELKKTIILSIIHISQQGDHFGAQMLQLYYDIVNNLM